MRCQRLNVGIKDGNIKAVNIAVGRRNDGSSIDGEEPLMSIYISHHIIFYSFPLALPLSLTI